MADSADEYFRRKLGNREMKGGGEQLDNIGHGKYRFIVTRFESVPTESSGMVSGIKFFVESSQAPDYKVEPDWARANAENSRTKNTILWDHPKVGKFAPERFAEFVIALFGLPSFGVTDMPAFPKPSDPDEVRLAWNRFFDAVNARHKEMRGPENICRGMMVDCSTGIGKKDREAWDAWRAAEADPTLPRVAKPDAPFINLRWRHVAGQTPESIKHLRSVLDEKAIP